MKILAIETSCDETSAAIVEGKSTFVSLKAQTLASSLDLHAKTGGIIPEQAAREQVKYMLPVLQETITKASLSLSAIDALAVTFGPGLIGSLLVGVETAKTLAYVLNKPLIPVNHMVGHIYANWIKSDTSTSTSKFPEFPLLALVVSGGHTDLILMKKHADFQLIGGTRDDAAGEAFDKIGRLLNFPYPAGPLIEQSALRGDPKRFLFPRPLLYDQTYEFSFSGLKTAVLREVQKLSEQLTEQTIADISRATQDAIIEVLTKKTLKAAKQYQAKAIILSGGVAANQTLSRAFSTLLTDLPINLFVPPKQLCTDNAAMIAAAAYFNQHPQDWETVTADPELYFE